MRLVLLAQGQWKVYALCKDENTCEVLEFIEQLDDKRARKVLSDLREFVPNSTAQDWVRIDLSWKLRGSDCALEFRWPTRRGGTPRVYWFYDENSVVVCSHGVNKKGETDEADIRKVERAREAYLIAKRAGNLDIVTFEEFVSDDDEVGDGHS